MAEEAFHPDEEVNTYIAGLSDEERTQVAEDRKFVDGLVCDIVPGIGFVTLAPEMTDEQKAQALDYLRWLKENRAKG
jgi:hypothetical protein